MTVKQLKFNKNIYSVQGGYLFMKGSVYMKQSLEKINIEAARIVSGATKLVSLENLYKEVGWETLEKKKRKT